MLYFYFMNQIYITPAQAQLMEGSLSLSLPASPSRKQDGSLSSLHNRLNEKVIFIHIQIFGK